MILITEPGVRPEDHQVWPKNKPKIKMKFPMRKIYWDNQFRKMQNFL